MPKFCKDCKWFMLATRHDGDDQVEYARCGNTATHTKRVDYVRGMEITETMHCSSARLSSSPCGPEGKLFEAKMEVSHVA